jgi:hypothetical protein
LDTKTLTETLREFLPYDFEWKFGLYTTRKSRDGLELDWNLCKMKGIASWVEAVKTFLLEKATNERTVMPYSPFLPKENIPAIERADELISERLWTVLADIKNGVTYSPEDFLSGVVSKPTGYGFYGCKKDEEGNITDEVLFMRRANPFLAGQRTRLCVTEADEIVTSEKPMLKFMPNTDFLLLGNVCYFISEGIEKDFELENRHYAIAGKRMADISSAEIVGNFDFFEKEAYSGKNARKFIDFDRKILEYIVQLPITEREEFLVAYGINIDKNGRMDTSDTEQCGLIIDLICGRSCLDPLGRLSVGSNITPRE